MATLSYPLRFESETQKKDIEKLAKENNRSLNAHILFLIDRAVLSNNQKEERAKLYEKQSKK